MTDQDLIVVLDASDGDDGETARLVGRLRAELSSLDIDAVEERPETPPELSKAGPGPVLALGVRLGVASVKAVVMKIRDWASRNDREVEVTIRGDTIKITKATDEQQERLIDAWLARHGRDRGATNPAMPAKGE
jgi:hypothetical protein